MDRKILKYIIILLIIIIAVITILLMILTSNHKEDIYIATKTIKEISDKKTTFPLNILKAAPIFCTYVILKKFLMIVILLYNSIFCITTNLII